MGRLNFEQNDGQQPEDGTFPPLVLFLASAVTSLWMIEALLHRAL